jgi:two-component system LytT family response regulator
VTQNRVLLVDDEPPARAKLRRLLAGEADFVVIGEAASGPAAIEAIADLRPDLVFLDVQMPGCDGFEVVSRLEPEAMPHVVFVTAHAEHALRAFEVRAVDYLLKPVTPGRLQAALARIRDTRLRGQPTIEMAQQLKQLAEMLAARPRPAARLLVHTATSALFITANRIDWVDSSANYVEIHVGHDTYRERGTLAALAERLDPDKFLRINRSQIVRLDAVKQLHPWSHGDYQVVLVDGTTLMWSRRYRARTADGFRL